MRGLAFAALVLWPVAVIGDSLGIVGLRMVEKNLRTTDAEMNDVYVDVYHFIVTNPNFGDVTSLELNFGGTWVNNYISPLTFANSTDLPVVFGETFADSFFVLPPGVSALAPPTQIIDDETRLAAPYSGSGAVLIAGGATAVLAVLSVPTGVLPDCSDYSGSAVINGVLEPIPCLPEPTAKLIVLVLTFVLILNRTNFLTRGHDAI